MEKLNVYTVLFRNNDCLSGMIRKVERDRLILTSGVTALRADVLIVGEGLEPREIVFSGRSSWNDVRQVQAENGEKLEVFLKDGRTIQGAEIQASITNLSIRIFGNSMTIKKDDIAWIDYVRFKPVSAAHRHLAQVGHGLQIFDPKVWQYSLKIGALMTVRIYDVELLEDNSKVACGSSPNP